MGLFLPANIVTCILKPLTVFCPDCFVQKFTNKPFKIFFFNAPLF
uniref:Uncharacterized protein n=1 Tax=Anguilla anguilla TaxID=7936 RepID=A0A0E9SQC8_ANGAN